jgi:hypothetical protein
VVRSGDNQLLETARKSFPVIVHQSTGLCVLAKR